MDPRAHALREETEPAMLVLGGQAQLPYLSRVLQLIFPTSPRKLFLPVASLPSVHSFSTAAAPSMTVLSARS